MSDQQPSGEAATGDDSSTRKQPPAVPPAKNRTTGATPGQQTAPAAPRSRHAATPWGRIWRALWFIPEPRSDRWWRSWFIRSLALLTGVLVLTGLFLASYLGALHNPTPQDLPVGVIRGDDTAQQLLQELQERDGLLRPVEYADAAVAQSALLKRRVYAVLSFSADPTAAPEAPTDAQPDAQADAQPEAPGDTPPAETAPDAAQPTAPTTGAELTVASGGSPSAVRIITDALTVAATAGSVPLSVTDIAPLSDEDPNGLSPFYLTLGWVLGGYLAATVLALSTGTVPREFDRAAMRLGALGAFSVVAGVLGALLTGPVLHIWSGHFVGTAITGALVCFAAATVTAALSGWLGMAGVGVAILLFVVVGNPGSGGIYAPELLPGFFSGLHHWVLPGLGTDLTRAVVYFGGEGPGRSVTGLVLYAAIGIAGLLAATAVLGKRGEGTGPGR